VLKSGSGVQKLVRRTPLRGAVEVFQVKMFGSSPKELLMDQPLMGSFIIMFVHNYKFQNAI
jgi:hypothetical protein